MRGKHHGHRHLYTDQRDKELFKAFCRAKEEQMNLFGKVSLQEAIETARTSPTTRYFISESRASILLKKMIQGDMELSGLGYMKVRQIKHLYFQYIRIKAAHPELEHDELVVMACAVPADEFYITHKTAIDILSMIHRNHSKYGLLTSDQSLTRKRRLEK